MSSRKRYFWDITITFQKIFVYLQDDTRDRYTVTRLPTETIWYDLNGRRLSSPPVNPGIYIVRYTDGTTRKIKI